MRLKHLRTATALACGGGIIALALTGCNAGGDASTTSGSSGKAAPAVNSTHDKTAEATNTSQGDTPSCMASELKADLQLQAPHSNEEEAEKAIATLTLTNRSGETCYLPAGWAPIGQGEQYNYTAIPSTRISYPGAGTTITLRPGSSAFAGTKWHTTKGCPGGTTSDLGVAWHSSWIPLTYHGLDDGYQPPICDSLTLGTLQPTMNGVNFT